MHNDMNMAFTGQPDVDFAQGMIPHHEGAIAMAEIVLAHGEDDEIRQLAEDIIAAQESEIAFLKAWLARKGY
ncbi:CopM family metallochaperone [Vreelandella piezotolerans]